MSPPPTHPEMGDQKRRVTRHGGRLLEILIVAIRARGEAVQTTSWLISWWVGTPFFLLTCCCSLVCGQVRGGKWVRTFALDWKGKEDWGDRGSKISLSPLSSRGDLLLPSNRMAPSFWGGVRLLLDFESSSNWRRDSRSSGLPENSV